MMKQFFSILVAVASPAGAAAAPTVVVKKAGAERTVVTVELAEAGTAQAAFVKSLKRNLALTGVFRVGPNGQIRITGTPGVSVLAAGAGKQVTSTTAFAEAKAARMAARQFADALYSAHTGKAGFASDRIAFVNRKGPDDAELYVCYPDGFDIRQLTSDKRAAVGPRWAPNKEDVYYTGFLQKTPLIYRINMAGRRNLLAQFQGLATGAAVSPDGKSCALILSSQGNPELYVLDFATKRVRRMTVTPSASEASPCWSPDGRQIAYVSDTTRHPQVYVMDVATKKTRRLTNEGRENTNPDWGPDGRIVWATKRNGQNFVAVIDPVKGDASMRLVSRPGSWEHPSWAADGRHVIASRDKALFILDTDPEGDEPVRLFYNEGHWMNPAWAR